MRESLVGKRFGTLIVLGRSELRGPRGKRTVPLWECRCDCGVITYKATDTLKSGKHCTCSQCAPKYAARKMREAAGFVDGTQISRIKSRKVSSTNTSGARGVYFDNSTKKWRARLRFKGKLMNFGTYDTFDEALKARLAAEERIFGEFIREKENKERG